MSGKVTDTGGGARELLARVREMAAGRTVKVGILADTPKREGVSERGKHSKKARIREKVARRAPYTLLEVAAIHEFGGKTVPQRSFIRATIDEKRAEILRLQVALAKQVVLGRLTPDQALAQLGAKVAGMIQARIAAGIAPPNAESTIRKKKSSKPLINTGQLRSAVTWKVEAA